MAIRAARLRGAVFLRRLAGGHPPLLLLAALAFAGCAPALAPDPGDAGPPAGDGGPGDGGPGDGGQLPGDARSWLDPHDAARAGTLTGVTVSPVPTPPLGALAWSPGAAAVAQAWAAGCSYQHNAGRGNRGENIAATAPPASRDAAAVVGLWGGEWSAYDYASNTCASGQVCGHYTQLVWRDTTAVGCAKVTCTTGWPFGGTAGSWDFWVCDYEPPGNYVGQRPY